MLLLKEVSPIPISFGGAAISGEGAGYGFGKISESEAIDLLLYAFAQGIRVYDTAPIYGFGLSEQRIGKAFSHLREKVFLVSKCGVDWNTEKRVNMTNDPQVAKKMLHESLWRLNTDYIDLYMIHWPDDKIDIRKTIEVLHQAQAEGKVKHLGLCNTNINDLSKASEVARIEVVQSEFNYFNHQAQDLFPYLEQQRISFMGWGPFDKGILTGSVSENRTFDHFDMRSRSLWKKRQNLESKFEEVKRLKAVCEKEGKTLLQFALEFILKNKNVTSIICGAKNQKQLDEILAHQQNLKNYVS